MEMFEALRNVNSFYLKAAVKCRNSIFKSNGKIRSIVLF